ncbi:glyoxalase [Hansschlegelia zhihuaiae]|uniref:Glyoxalase n=1 Tax=Hansschlegelia zhihuaiae TaxID=405005 RepID=A0A4Q0MKF9_9HYPH|nr:VOC family protein [Hansschlegelia zhihuaiae]RXF73923.1 glyoxalase [Hansschlegelia zhihuaiae]
MNGSGQGAPKVRGILESALYVENLARSAAFYDRVFDFPHLFGNDALIALDVAGAGVLLLFRRGGSAKAQEMPGGVIPAHDGEGKLHAAFAIAADDLPVWEKRLDQLGIAVESRMSWPLGGTSVYFRDPDGHLLELVTPKVWPTY